MINDSALMKILKNLWELQELSRVLQYEAITKKWLCLNSVGHSVNKYDMNKSIERRLAGKKER